MDTKEIVEKALKGEDYSLLIKDLPVEEQTKIKLAVRDAADAAAKVNLEKVDALHKEEQRLKDKKDNQVSDVLESFKKEQVEKAKKRFFADTDYPLTDAEKISLESEINSKGIQSTDAEFVFDEIKRIYGSLKVDSLISDKKKAEEGQRGAERFNSQAAGANNSGPTGDPDKYTAPVKELWQKVVQSGHKNFTLDDAKRLFEKGTGYKSRSLAG